MAILSKGTLFPEKLVEEIFSKVQGKSSLVKLSKQIPIAFNGNEMFVFSMDNEVDLVAESGAKSHGGVTIDPVKTAPYKVEYGARVSDEFMNASEEEQINILKPFNDGFAKKLARALDIMAMHGLNPRTKAASAVIGANNLDSKVTQLVTYNSSDPDANIQSAVNLVQGADREVSGLALSTIFGSALADYKVNGVIQFPEFRWGACPDSKNGLGIDVNSTVTFGTGTKDRAIVGNFADMFKWGYAKDVKMEIIEYGDPDNTGKDLKGYNQVYIRCEAYIGWAIMDAESFARIVAPTDVTITAAANGTSGSVTSTKITLTFNVDVYGLKAEHITLADGTGSATKGALTGSGKNWELALTAVATQGNVSLTIADIGGFDFPSTGTTVAVYKAS